MTGIQNPKLVKDISGHFFLNLKYFFLIFSPLPHFLFKSCFVFSLCSKTQRLKYARMTYFLNIVMWDLQGKQINLGFSTDVVPPFHFSPLEMKRKH